MTEKDVEDFDAIVLYRALVPVITMLGVTLNRPAGRVTVASPELFVVPLPAAIMYG